MSATAKARPSNTITASYEARIAAAADEATFAKSREAFVHPVRVNRTSRTIGHFPSQVMAAQVPFHSELERVLLNVLDLTVGVSRFWPQAETFLWFDGKRRRRYTPDCGVEVTATRMMIEAKYEDDAWTPDNVEIREQSAPFLKAEGWDLLLVTDTVLLYPDLLKNIRTIRRRRAHPYDEMAVRKLQHELLRHSMPFDACTEIVTSLGADADLLYAAIGRRELCCNLWNPLDGSAVLIHPDRAPRPFLLDLLGDR